MNDSMTAIVVVAYNRPKSLSRILISLQNANYPGKSVPLIISIDRGEHNLDVLEIAENFNWSNGQKKVVYQEKNLGLRAHILQCGNYCESYGSVIILEDDLYVSTNFYYFTRSALEFSANKEYIGGISLYNHEFNVHVKENFKALDDGYDNWYFQFASSWGQAWSKKQWEGFKKWYDNDPQIDQCEMIPQNVRSWSSKSWLKYYTAYLILKDKFFLYPRCSLTTNFSDVGTHVGTNSTAFQVPLQQGPLRNYLFSNLKDSLSVYDAFFEHLLSYRWLGTPKEDTTADLYGYKSNITTRFLITTKILNFKILKTYGCLLKPHDLNLLSDISGKDIFLYDTSKVEENSLKLHRLNRILYNVKYLNLQDAIILFLKLLALKIRRIAVRLKL